MTCERLWQAQAVDERRLGPGDVAAFERHARTCASCKQALAEGAELRLLTEALPRAAPSELGARRLRARVLRDAMAPPVSRRPRVQVLAVGLAVAFTLLLFVGRVRHPASAPAAFAGTVVPGPGARFRQVREGDVERVVLADGEIHVHVRKQGANERFLVMVPDGEVEVRGTTFEVTVHDHRTTRVHVDDGVVVVRLGETSTLDAGEDWPAEVSRPAPSPTPSPLTPPVPSPGPPPTPGAPRKVQPEATKRTPAAAPIATRALAPDKEAEPASRSDGRELPDYERAVAVYRAGRFEEAAERLHAFGLAYPSSSLLDDASFLEASSLASAGRSDAAALLAERHLVRFPSSFHRKEAAILVTRLRRDRGDCEGARKAAGPWLDESPLDPRVVIALGGCLGR